MEIRGMREYDIEGYLDCEERIWESMRGLLPQEYVERCIAWNQRENVREAWKRVLAEPNWIALVAVEGGSVVGLAHGSMDWSRLSSLGFLGVDEDHRRRGIARGLVERFIEESRARGGGCEALRRDGVRP
jgi:ribosomal protein S18 acetylase RimI-like enzyme